MLISEVDRRQPGGKAGLKPGDILLEFEGKKTEEPADLQRAVGSRLAGQERQGQGLARQAREDRRGEDRRGARAIAKRSNGGSPAAPSALGLDVRPITPEIARQLNLRRTKASSSSRVEEGTSAAEAGIQRGDVIREVNRPEGPKTMTDYERFTREAKDGDRLTVLLQRGQMSLYVAFTG